MVITYPAATYLTLERPRWVFHSIYQSAFFNHTMVNNRSKVPGVIAQRRASVIKKAPKNSTIENANGIQEEKGDGTEEEGEGRGRGETSNVAPKHEVNSSPTTMRPRRARNNPSMIAKGAIKGKTPDDDEWTPTDKKRHRCTHCPMKFKKPSALVIHMRTHSGERPYMCKLCSKTFSISGNLRRHMFTHTGEKPYKCQACGRAFNNPSHLARHSRKIHI